MNYRLIICLLLLVQVNCFAQDTVNQSGKIFFSGYIKDMQSLRFNENFQNLVSGNLIHNRLNARWKPSNYFYISAEVRNRLFWGEEVAQTPGFLSMMKNPNDALDMEKVWLEKDNLILLTNIERLFADMQNDNWNLRMGRQRINWGINMIWNPNDIFNTYNFLDFDYEERPGADAVKVVYRTGDLSSAELVYSRNAAAEQITALRYFFNKWDYDIQFIAGLYHDHATIGAGWAGNMGEAGLKGEAQYFFSSGDSGEHFNLASEISHLFKKGWLFNGGIMINSSGIDTPVMDIKQLGYAVTPERIMPGKWSVLAGIQKEFTPLFSGNICLVYSPGVNLFILFPSFTFSIARDLDADLFWQSFFLEQGNQFRAISHQGFLRLKWNF